MFIQDWDAKPRRGRQRKVWSRLIDDPFVALDVNKAEWLEDTSKFKILQIKKREYRDGIKSKETRPG